MRVERHIDDELQELMAEGRRRVREYEGMAPVATDGSGKVIGFQVGGEVVSGCVGTHKMAGGGLPMSEALTAALKDSETFALYLPKPEDIKGLEQELTDLLRDGELVDRHEGVRYV